ncbi:hypothetical protein BKI52_23915 [marine bacterium AO1-C]|nr:hypothetical protein BKI52_23915 [marine bacterium AO1-C]
MNHFFAVIRQWTVVWCLLGTQIAIGQVPQSEFDALKKFYNATNGDGWTNRTGWENINTTATANDVNDTWEGITVVGGHVTQIQFNRNNLIGTIPAEIDDFPQLASLVLSNNLIAGSIPTNIGNLTELTSLMLSGNVLSGAIPTEIGNLTKLVVLSLHGNSLNGQIPSEIKALTLLKTLFLSNNQLEGAIPTEIEHLVLLETLVLRNNRFTSLPASINKLVNLDRLHLQNNRLTTLPAEIGGLVNLDELNLEENQLTALPKEIGDLANLTDLRLAKNQLISVPQELGNLSKLRRIELQDNQLTSLPDFSGSTSFTPTLFWVQDNALQFGHIVLNRLKITSYRPQAKYTPTTTNITVNDGETLTLNGVITGGANNRYQWFKDGSSTSISSKSASPVFTKNGITTEDAGTYVCKVTNLQAPNLTIESESITVNVVDNNAPTLQSTFPSNDRELAIDLTTLSITFNEKIQKGTGELLIKNKDSDQVVQRIPADAVSDIGSTLIIRISVLPEGHYYITTPQGFVKDLADNLFAGILNNSTWSFTINKNEKPTVETFAPADNSTSNDASTLTSLSINFSEEVQKGTGYVRIRKAGSGTLTQLINIRSSLVTVNGKTVAIQLDGLLTDETSYYVTISSTALQDLVGNNYGGIDNQTTWNFSLGTPIAPTLAQTSPTHQSTNVEVNIPSLKMTFSEKIAKGVNGYVLIKKVANDEEVATVGINSSLISIQDKEATIRLNKFLEPTTQYYVSVPSGTFTDAAGLAFAGITDRTTWQFTTGASNVPLIETVSPAHNSTVNAAFNALTINFSEDIQKGAGFIEIYDNNDDLVDFISASSSDVAIEGQKAVITFNASKLEPSTSYYVTIPSSAFKNAQGNEFAGFEKGQWAFSTTVVSGIATLNQGTLKVHPNPTSDIVYITLENNPTKTIRFEAIDIRGKVVKSGTLGRNQQNSIRVTEWPKGNYLLRLYIGKTTINKRFIKK